MVKKICGAVAGVVLAAFAGCGDPVVGTEGMRLLAEECVPTPGDRLVGICHATGSETNPYVHIRIAPAGCISGHVDHEGDFRSDDPDCPLEPEYPPYPDPCTRTGTGEETDPSGCYETARADMVR